MHKREKGDKGEDIACDFLKGKGFDVIERNYQRKWGELDIICQKDKSIHFFEVKSVMKKFSNDKDIHRPEDNVNDLKIRKIRRMVETYLIDKGIDLNINFQFHVLSIYVNEENHNAQVKWFKNVIL